MSELLKQGFYPRYCFQRAPTADRWCFLTGRLIHDLIQPPDYAGQGLFFHRNLPIKWVRIVGMVVAIDDFYPIRIYTLDDSSGACIEAIINAPRVSKSTGNAAAALEAEIFKQIDAQQHNNSNKPTEHTVAASEEDAYARIDVGDMLDVKGSLSLFRGETQIKTTKISTVRGTAQELDLWDRRAGFRAQVLDQPWVLTEAEVKECKKVAEKAEKQERRRREKERLKKPEKTVEEVRAMYSKSSLKERRPESVIGKSKPGDEVSKEAAEYRSRYMKKSDLRSVKPAQPAQTKRQDKELDDEALEMRAKYTTTYHSGQSAKPSKRASDDAEGVLQVEEASSKPSLSPSTSSRRPLKETALDPDAVAARSRYMNNSTLAKPKIGHRSVTGKGQTEVEPSVEVREARARYAAGPSRSLRSSTTPVTRSQQLGGRKGLAREDEDAASMRLKYSQRGSLAGSVSR